MKRKLNAMKIDSHKNSRQTPIERTSQWPKVENFGPGSWLEMCQRKQFQNEKHENRKRHGCQNHKQTLDGSQNSRG